MMSRPTKYVWLAADDAWLTQLVNDGETLDGMSAHLGVDRHRIYRRIVKLGLQPKLGSSGRRHKVPELVRFREGTPVWWNDFKKRAPGVIEKVIGPDRFLVKFTRLSGETTRVEISADKLTERFSA